MAQPQELTEEEKQMLQGGCHGASALPPRLTPNEGSSVKHVIGVVSG